MGTETITPCTLTGAALQSEARRLAVPGRSRMSADELRAAVGAAVGAAIVAEYRAACTAYARQETGSGPRLRAAVEAMDAAGIPSWSVETPDDCIPCPNWLEERTGEMPDQYHAPIPAGMDLDTPPALDDGCTPVDWDAPVTLTVSGGGETFSLTIDTSQVVTRICPVTGNRDCKSRECPEHWLLAPAPGNAYLRPECPVTGDRYCKSRECELHYMSAPLRLTPWTSATGKRKRNHPRRIRNRSI